MKRKARVAILGAMLHVGAHAAGQSGQVPSAPDKGAQKVAVAQPVAASAKKGSGRRKKANKVAASTTPAAEPKQDTPAEEQSLQLKGVRG